MAVPVWSESIVIPDQALTMGNAVRGTLDLRGRFGAQIMVAIGRSFSASSTNPGFSTGVDVLIRRTISADLVQHVSPVAAFRTALGVSIGKTTLTAAYPAGTTAVVLASATNFTADDLLCFWGLTADPVGVTNGTLLPNLEFARVSKLATATITLDSPLRAAKLNGERVLDQAESYLAWVEGGAIYEVVIDFGDDTIGDAVAVRARAQVLESAV